MARRMTFEGAKVKVVAELMPYSGGLKRNIVQCLDDYGIPLKLSHTVVEIRGKERLTGVTIAKAVSYTHLDVYKRQALVCAVFLSGGFYICVSHRAGRSAGLL